MALEARPSLSHFVINPGKGDRERNMVQSWIFSVPEFVGRGSYPPCGLNKMKCAWHTVEGQEVAADVSILNQYCDY